MSYGKIDHDRFGLLVALAVLPTAGRARHGDKETTEAGGWALRLTQVGVVCTYFLASMAKLRFGGLALADRGDADPVVHPPRHRAGAMAAGRPGLSRSASSASWASSCSARSCSS